MHLPCAVSPASVISRVERVQGYASKMTLHVVLPVDRTDWSSGSDAGSKPWLVAQALHEGDGAQGQDMNPYAPIKSSSSSSNKTNDTKVQRKGNAAGSDDDDDDDDDAELPEDKFHLSLPAGVDKYTGVKLDDDGGGNGDDDIELPEDRFHRQDASSSYLINQREQAIKDKWAKHEK
jgi:hypothetical protein